jgi:hypothetical protein
MTELLSVPGERADRVTRAPLALQQEFLRMMDGGGDSGPFSPRYTIVAGWRVAGRIDLEVLRAALEDVVARHEALRTRIVLDDGDAYQRIGPATAPQLLLSDLPEPADGDRDRAVELYLNEVESTVSVPEGAPPLKVALGRFDEHDGVLVFVAHHTVVDGSSVHVLMRDFAACYAARRAGRPADLPPVRQYREYVEWQQRTLGSPEVASAQEFWREYLKGARMFGFPTDRPRSPGAYVTGWHRFAYEDQFRLATLATAKRLHSSPFMVLTAAMLTLLRDRTGESDLVIPTLTSGRHPIWTEHMIGTFYNFMPLRANIGGCTDFADVVAAVRTGCLTAYRHELPFLQLAPAAPELMADAAGPAGAAIAFQIIQHPAPLGGEPVGDLRLVAIRRRAVSTPVGSQIPDGILAELDLHPDGGMFGKVAYVKSLFDDATIERLIAQYRQILGDRLDKV